jgi:hypothetical protein
VAAVVHGRGAGSRYCAIEAASGIGNESLKACTERRRAFLLEEK